MSNISLLDIIKEAKLASNSKDLEKNSIKLENSLDFLKNKNKVLILATSNRWEGHKDDEAKSTILAKIVHNRLGTDKSSFIDVSKLNIFVCEGNVSTKWGNRCGSKESMLKDKEKNPTGMLRCWSSFNNKTDELWKVSNALFESDCVMFFTSIRWGQTNSIYQKLIERLTWLENRHTTLGESNILKDKDVGIIAIGHNWRGKQVIETQKEIFNFFGFNVPSEISWNWQYTDDKFDETKVSYKNAIKTFKETYETYEK